MKITHGPEDAPCRTCALAEFEFGVSSFRKGERSRMWVVCRKGRLGRPATLLHLPPSCSQWKEGGENMGLLDFKGRTKEELRAELEKIRSLRAGCGREKRKASQTERVRKAVGKKRESVVYEDV